MSAGADELQMISPGDALSKLHSSVDSSKLYNIDLFVFKMAAKQACGIDIYVFM